MKNLFEIVITILIGFLLALLVAEIFCQSYFAIKVSSDLEVQRNDPLHYYVASGDPALRYELKPDYRIEKEGRRIAINSHGIRDDSNITEYPRKVALLGDSVAFGIGLSQEETPTAYLQELAGGSLKILNFGTPGYGLEELQRYLEIKYPVYRPEQIVYLLNLNDFSRRNTIYEGADNGLYRMYHRPFIMLPLFVGKAIYRFMKEGRMSSVRWYRWLYEGNKHKGLAIIKQMADFAKAQGSQFSVVLHPPAVAYEHGGFAVQNVIDEIEAYLMENGIPVVAPVSEFSQLPYELQGISDHFTPAGNKVIAKIIWRAINND